jgi:nucleoside-diphosphate-sugar epimerase
MKFAITGANGYIATHLIQALINNEHQVVILSRKKPPLNCEWQYFDLDQFSEIDLASEVTCIFHLAISDVSKNLSDGIKDLEAAKNLLLSAKYIGAKFIFFSSQTASDQAVTNYGRLKKRIEKLVLNNGGEIIRPGLVYGGLKLGLFGELLDSIDRFPILPKILPEPKVFPIHIDDLVRVSIKIAMRPNELNRIWEIGERDGVFFSIFMMNISRKYLNKKTYFIPINAYLIIILSKIIKNSSSLSRLMSLIKMKDLNSKESLKELNISTIRINANVDQFDLKLKKRIILLEGWKIFKYIYGNNFSNFQLRKYVSYMIKEEKLDQMNLYTNFIIQILIIGLADRNILKDCQQKRNIQNKLSICVKIFEASQYGGKYEVISPNRIKAIMNFLKDLIIISCKEISWFLISVIYRLSLIIK